MKGFLAHVLREQIEDIPRLRALPLEVVQVPVDELVVEGRSVKGGVAVEKELEADVRVLVLEGMEGVEGQGGV